MESLKEGINKIMILIQQNSLLAYVKPDALSIKATKNIELS
jgi:hypothetical protein